LNNKSVLESGIDVGTEPIRGIEVVVKSGAGSIQGKTISESKTVAAANVALVPATRRDNLSLYRATTSDAEGRFLIEGIAPGDYKLFAWRRWLPAPGRILHFLQGTSSMASLCASRRMLPATFRSQ
jgi:hypothetical protein